LRKSAKIKARVPEGFIIFNTCAHPEIRAALRAAASLEGVSIPVKLDAILRAHPSIRRLLKKSAVAEPVSA
jgi:hypothetical protein